MWKKRNVVRWKNRWMNLQSRGRRREAGRELRETLPAEAALQKNPGHPEDLTGAASARALAAARADSNAESEAMCL